MDPGDDIRLHNLLVASDFSAASEKAVRHALAIARYFGAKPYVLHITRSYRDVSVSDLEQGNLLERELETCNGHFAFREGEVWEELQKFIRQRQIELVVVGTHGRTGFKKLMLGSVAENVFRHVSCPVVTVGPNSPNAFDSRPQLTVRPVLFATDFCEGCDNALAYAVTFANRRKTRLALLHVLSRVPAVDGNRWFTAEDVERKREASRLATLQRLENLVSSRAMSLQPLCMAEFGSPAEKILGAAKSLQAEVIIMGLQRPSLTDTHLSWSTAYEVVCIAPCPVMTVRSGS